MSRSAVVPQSRLRFAAVPSVLSRFAIVAGTRYPLAPDIPTTPGLPGTYFSTFALYLGKL